MGIHVNTQLGVSIANDKLQSQSDSLHLEEKKKVQAFTSSGLMYLCVQSVIMLPLRYFDAHSGIFGCRYAHKNGVYLHSFSAMNFTFVTMTFLSKMKLKALIWVTV